MRRSKQANDYLAEAKGFSNFKRMVFPDEFIDFDEKFDVALLVNVLNIMPVPIERLCALVLIRERMNEDGRLLWYTQHGGYKKSDAVANLLDGMVTGQGRKYHMFYRDFTTKEIHDLLRSTGFSHIKDLKFPSSGGNQAYAFNPDSDILVDQGLGLTQLLKRGRSANVKEIEREVRWPAGDGNRSKVVLYKTVVPKRIIKPKEVNILESYLRELQTIRTGAGKRAPKYHHVILNILAEVFSPALKNPKKETKLNNGRKRVDVTFDNKAENGFFKDLRDKYNIICPIIFIECKNYKKALETPEYDQIAGRLNRRRGMFGIIVCRATQDKAKALEYCRDLVRDNPGAEKYVIILTDVEIKKMVKAKLEKNEDLIDTLLLERYKALIL